MTKQQSADHWQIGQNRDVYRPDLLDLLAHVIQAHQRRQPGTKDGQGKPGGNLVRKQGEGQHRKNQRGNKTAQAACQQACQWLAGKCHRGKAEHRADQHHALNPQIQYAGFFTDQLSSGGKDQRCRCRHHRHY